MRATRRCVKTGTDADAVTSLFSGQPGPLFHHRKDAWFRMWILSNETPFAAKESWTRDERGHETWLIAIKASFEIDADGKQRLVKEQAPVNLAPVFGDDPNELLDETDLNPEKKHTDVLIEGHVYAPGGRPAVESAARVKVGDIDRRSIWSAIACSCPARCRCG